MLARNDHPWQATVVEDLLSCHATDFDRFSKRLWSVDVWGGAGAVWEVNIQGADRFAFRDAIIRLSRAMDECGLGFARSRDIAEIFQEWNRARL